MNKPKTEREWCLYRAGLSCKVGKDALDGKSPPAGVSAVEYACYNLLIRINPDTGEALPNGRLEPARRKP